MCIRDSVYAEPEKQAEEEKPETTETDEKDKVEDEIKKYFPPEYDEQKIRTVICQLLEEWSNQNH